jgi:hypothetical protein
VLCIFFLFLFSNLTNSFQSNHDLTQAISTKPFNQLPSIKENHPPETPQQPQGSTDGNAGVNYIFSTSTIDPDGDSVFYYADWGDSTESTWIGPFPSGAIINISHLWETRGIYTLRVKAKDSFDAESNWSESLQIAISGPYLTLENISGGLGLNFEIQNIGEMDAEDITVDISAEQGIFIVVKPNQLHIDRLPAGSTTQQQIHLWGVGLGILTNLPKITITIQESHTKTRGKQIEIRLLGFFVKKIGESWSTDESYNGYTLYSPMVSLKTFLINNNGTTIHTWESNYKPALSVYLLENGDLLRTAFPGYSPRFWGGGIGGRVERFDWNGTLRWYFEYSTDQHCLHHDIQMLPNGNILMIAWEYKSAQDAISKGRNPTSIPQGQLWPDHLIEVHPNNDSGGTIVWEWHLWDHLIQDYDSTKENYGVVPDHPELVDINYGGKVLADWTHINSVDYSEEYDQILLSVLTFNEIWIIDHSTTTEEAAGHTGGRYGKGGDLLYRWGNPLTYKRGNQTNQILFGQHDAEWIASGLPGAGDILIFNNGIGRPSEAYSTIEEITPPMESDGTYRCDPNSTYGPQESTWKYTADQPTDFFAINLGGAQRLPNGNTLICNGPAGRFFEVTSEKEIVWQFENQIPDPVDHHVFKIERYTPDYPGLHLL